MSTEMEKIGQALHPLLPTQAWLLIYLPKEQGHVCSLSPMSNELQAKFAEGIWKSFSAGSAKEVANIKLEPAPADFTFTLAEVELIRALRKMPRDESWCRELGFCVIGEDEYGTGWGTNLQLALVALGKERGEKDV
jgi:hypothetical protein